MTGGKQIRKSANWHLWVLLVVLFFPASSSGEVIVRISEISIGFSGHYKIGYWVPVFVSLDCQGRGELSIELTVPDGDGVPSTTISMLQIGGSASSGINQFDKSVAELFCKIGRSDGELRLVIREGQRLLAEANYPLKELGYPPLPSDAELLLAIGQTPNIERAITQSALQNQASVTLAQLASEDRLPSKWFAYDGVDLVIVCGSCEGIKSLTHQPKAVAALLEWIQIGGNLLLSIGAGAESFLKQGGPLAEFAPGSFVDLISTRQLEALETFAGSADPLIKEDHRGRPEAFVIPYFESSGSRELLGFVNGSERIPLLQRKIVGFGQVTLLAMDLEQAEFTIWNGTRKLITQLLPGAVNQQQDYQVRASSELAHTGYDDLAGQLRAALDQFEEQGVRFIPFELLFLLGVVYLLLIAPGDYFFLKRVVGRMHATWITFPLLVVLSSVGTYLFARATKGDRRLVNQAELIDIDVASGQVRAACWFSIFSPQTDRYNLSARCQLPSASTDPQANKQLLADPEREGSLLLSWMGLPGTGLGGMESPIATPQFDLGYHYGPRLATMQGVPISIWSTKCFAVRLQGHRRETIQANLSARPESVNPLIQGTITNLLSKPIERCVLLHNRWAYPLGTLEPGQTVKVSKDISIRTVRNYLTRLGPWEMESDVQRRDISRIFERMLFYRAAGGREWIPLQNEYLQDVDMTALLEDQRALLVGWIGSQTFQIMDREQTLSYPDSLRAAMYRFVLPVGQRIPE